MARHRVEELNDVARISLSDSLENLKAAYTAMKTLGKAGEVGTEIVSDRIMNIAMEIDEILDFLNDVEGIAYRGVALEAPYREKYRANPKRKR